MRKEGEGGGDRGESGGREKERVEGRKQREEERVEGRKEREEERVEGRKEREEERLGLGLGLRFGI